MQFIAGNHHLCRIVQIPYNIINFDKKRSEIHSQRNSIGSWSFCCKDELYNAGWLYLLKSPRQCIPTTYFSQRSEENYFVIIMKWAASWQTQQNGIWAQQRLRSAWASAQVDFSLRWGHSHFVGFVMKWLQYHFSCRNQMRLHDVRWQHYSVSSKHEYLCFPDLATFDGAESRVNTLVAAANSHDNLCRMDPAWHPWL